MELPRDCDDSTRVSSLDRGRRGNRLLEDAASVGFMAERLKASA